MGPRLSEHVEAAAMQAATMLRQADRVDLDAAVAVRRQAPVSGTRESRQARKGEDAWHGHPPGAPDCPSAGGQSTIPFSALTPASGHVCSTIPLPSTFIVSFLRMPL